MILTLNQVLNIILTVAAVVVVTFLVLFLNQLRKTAREAEKTMAKAQEAIDGLQVIEAKINAGLDGVGEAERDSIDCARGVKDDGGGEWERICWGAGAGAGVTRGIAAGAR